MMQAVHSLQNRKGRFARKLLFAFELLVFAGQLVVSPTVEAFQLQVQQDIQLRGLSQSTMSAVGVITAGSTVDVPDQYRVLKRGGGIDIPGSLKKWVTQVGYAHTNNPNLGSGDGSNDFLFPIHVVRASPGSQVAGLAANQEYYIPLRYLANKGKLLQTKEASTVYAWGSAMPFESLAARSAMESADQATGDCHCNQPQGQALTQAAAAGLSQATAVINQARPATAPAARPSRSSESRPAQSPVRPTAQAESRPPTIQNRPAPAASSSQIDREVSYAMAHREGHSQQHCWRYVKHAIYAAGLAPRDSLSTIAAVSAVSELRAHGWTDLVNSGRTDLLTHPERAPVGSVIVYRQHLLPGEKPVPLLGHTEIRTSNGYVSDYYSPRSVLGPHFSIIGVMVPPGN